MKLKLRPVDHGKDKNRFCGPAVISALTPLTTGEAARLIRKQSGRSAVMGTHNHEIRRALQACNIEMTAVTDYPGLNRTTGPTLAAWLKMSKSERTRDRVFLVTAGWHWQLISGRRYVCGRTGEIVSVRDKKVKRRARVADVWELTSDNVSRPKVNVSRPRPKDLQASARAKAKRIAEKIEADIEVLYDRYDTHVSMTIMVYPPNGFFFETFHESGPDKPHDPYDGSHLAYDWQEALEMLQEYEKIINVC